MTYEMLEALLVTKIADLRKSEKLFERSLKAAKRGIQIDLTLAHDRVKAQMHEVEQVLSQLETTPAYGTLSMAAIAQSAPLAVA